MKTIRVYMDDSMTADVACERLERRTTGEKDDDGTLVLIFYVGPEVVAFFDTYFGWQDVTPMPAGCAPSLSHGDIYQRGL